MVGKGELEHKYNTRGGVLVNVKDEAPIKSHQPTNQPPCPLPSPWLCNLVPVDVPSPGAAQAVLHPRKDVFVLKVAKISPTGDRHCKMELELVTPKFPDKRLPYRVDTREAQCDPDPPCCCCSSKCRRI